MAEHIEASYKASVRDAEDGAFVLVRHGDGSTIPAIKGSRRGETFVAFLADRLPRAKGGHDNGPFVVYGDDWECLSLGKGFTLHFNPEQLEFRQDGRWELGNLMVTHEEIMICARSKDGQEFVNLSEGTLVHPRPAAAFSSWSLGIRQIDGKVKEVYRRNAVVEVQVTGI